MVKDALMELTSIVSVEVHSLYGQNAIKGRNENHHSGPFGTFAWHIIFDRTPWHVPLLHASNIGMRLLANSGGFVEIIPVSQGSSFGIDLEVNDIAHATQEIACTSAISTGATALMETKFALKMSG